MAGTVSRRVKGGRHAFFESADSDRLLAMMMQLVTEHWATRERVLVLEQLLVDKGILNEAEIDQYRPDPKTDAAWDAMSFEVMQAIVEAGRNIERR